MNTYQLTDDEYNELLEASKPVPYMVFNGTVPEGPIEKSERIWRRIAGRVGCDWRTIGAGPTQKQFCAEPTQPPQSPVKE